VEINGVADPTWEKALGLLNEAAPGSVVHLVVESNGVRRTVDVPVKDAAQADRLLGYRPFSAMIEEVMAGKPADRAGLRPDDEVVAVNGQRIATWSQFTDAVRGSEGRRLLLKVRRSAQEISLEVDPQKDANEQGETFWMIGVLPHVPTAYRPVGVGEAGRDAVLVTASGIEQVLGVVGKLFTGRVSVRQLQGVVGIARESGKAVSKGWTKVLEMMVLISVNLGILNLLPIPILDGGHILLLAIEGTLRRDLSLRFKERFVQVGFVFLLVLFGFVMYNDVVRILPKH
jgi:regulator of sigma E protease